MLCIQHAPDRYTAGTLLFSRDCRTTAFAVVHAPKRGRAESNRCSVRIDSALVVLTPL